jgi:hypothetical protein
LKKKWWKKKWWKKKPDVIWLTWRIDPATWLTRQDSVKNSVATY